MTSRIASILQNRLENFESPPELSLGGLVSRIGIAAGTIDASLATQLGSHLTKSRLFPEDPESQTYPWKDPEKRELAEALELLSFMSAAGASKPAKQLLIQDSERHERLRAALAPPERVLAPEYETSADALSFFPPLSCRNAGDACRLCAMDK